MDNDSYPYPGFVKINQLILIEGNNTPANNFVDLIGGGFLLEFNLIEDIFSSFLHGTVSIQDLNNLLTNFPIFGEEYLFIDMITPGNQSSIKKLFRIYAITDREIQKGTDTQTYTLEFCSLEAFENLRNPIMLPYAGNSEKVATTIFSKFLSQPKSLIQKNGKYEFTEDDKSQLKIILPENTASFIRFVSPGWTPASCINWIAARMKPDQGLSSSYMFFENNNNFYLTNLENLYNIPAVNETYNYSPLTADSDVQMIKRRTNIIAFSAVKMHNKLMSTMNGHYTNRIVSVDLHKKRIKYNDYNYFRNFENYKHPLQNSGDTALPFVRDKKTSPTSAKQHIKLNFFNDHLFSSSAIKNGNMNLSEIYGHRISLLHSLREYVLNVTIYGRTDLKVGHSININIPDIMLNNNATEIKEDRIYSGKYLITNIRHQVFMITGKANYHCILELVKDNFSIPKGTS